jgi:ketosteroid isomerase-like protein
MTAPLEVMRRYIAAARRGDWDAAFACYADDAVGRVPGRSALAGELRGREAIRRYIETARALSHGHDVELELIDMLASEERVALLLSERFHLEDRTVDIRRANVYRVRGDEIAEVWIFEGDQYEVDALFAAGDV